MKSKQDSANSFAKKQDVVHLGGVDALARPTLDPMCVCGRRGLRS